MIWLVGFGILLLACALAAAFRAAWPGKAEAQAAELARSMADEIGREAEKRKAEIDAMAEKSVADVTTKSDAELEKEINK